MRANLSNSVLLSDMLTKGPLILKALLALAAWKLRRSLCGGFRRSCWCTCIGLCRGLVVFATPLLVVLCGRYDFLSMLGRPSMRLQLVVRLVGRWANFAFEYLLNNFRIVQVGGNKFYVHIHRRFQRYTLNLLSYPSTLILSPLVWTFYAIFI